MLTMLLYFLGGFTAIIAFGIFLHLKQKNYDDRVDGVIDDSINRQIEKESNGFAKMPERYRNTAIEQRAVRSLIQRRVRLPDNLSERIRRRMK